MAAISSSLNGLLFSVGAFLRDSIRAKVTTAGTTTTLTAAALALGAANVESNHFVGSELYFETTTGMTGEQPYRVTAYNPTSGLLTFTPSWGVAPPLNAEFVVQNLQGNGWPHQLKLEAIVQSLRDLGVMTRAKATIAAPDQVSYWNAIPAGLDSIYMVQAVESSGIRTTISPNIWADRVNFLDRTIYLPYSVANGLTFQVFGRVKYAEPTDYTAAIPNINTAVVTKMAAERLMSASGLTPDRRVWQGLYESRMRGYRDTPLPNEIFLQDFV